MCGGVAQARGTCAIAAKKAPPLTVEVAPKEASPFKLRIEGMPIAVEPGGLETPATVHVKGALAFDAHLGNDAIPARTKRGTDDLSGMVHLAAAREKLTLHANVRAKLVDAAVRLTGIELRGLTLPCDALTLDDVAPPAFAPDEGSVAPRFVAKSSTLHFRSAPGGRGAEIEVAVDDASALELKRIEEEGDWMRVTTRWPDGTTLHGWVKREELVEEGVRHERLGDLTAPANLAAGACEPLRVGDNEKVVAAPVTAGAQVFAARYLGPWAKVVDGSKLKIRYRAKDDWVEIVAAPGVACPLGDAWIPRTAVKLPPDAPAP
ncbi:MAG TPA: hypothetical protein VGL86_06265 [Polyangia bacterium]